MADSPEEIKKHIKSFWIVGGVLLVFTCVTLALGYFDIGAHGIDWPDVVLGLMVATTKASLVALIFMHLNHERGLIYKLLLFTVVFAVGLMFLTLFADSDPIQAVFDVSGKG